MRFSQNCIFEVVGVVSRTNAPILLGFCTLLLDKFDLWLNEGFFFCDYNLFYKPIHGLILTENHTVLHTTRPKIQILIFFQYFVQLRAILTYQQKIFDFLFRIKLSRVILATAKILFLRGLRKSALNTAQFSIFFHTNYMKFYWNVVLSYAKSLNKIIHLIC